MDNSFGFIIIGGVIAMFISWIWVVVIAFKESAWWGIGSLLLNPVALIYALTHTKKCKTPLILFSVGLFLSYGIMLIFGASDLSPYTKRQIEPDREQWVIMGTFAHVIAIAEDSGTEKKCVRAAQEEIRKVDELMSDYKSNSEISRINSQAGEKAVKVSESTYEVLKRSIEFSDMTDGAFDITVGPLVALFHNAKESKIAPSAEQIALARSKVGFEKLKLDSENKTVQFSNEGMLLDLGGIAKGYAIDKAIEAAQHCGATGAMVDIGGDVRCFGSPPEGRNYWLIGLQDPNSAIKGIEGGGLLLVLQVNNAAVATSGDYQQYALIEGKRYSHIMDRRTGTSTESLSSVTIIADNATDADALATAVSVMGAEKGLALIEKMPNTEAILITPQPKYEIIKTSGAEKYIKSSGP